MLEFLFTISFALIGAALIGLNSRVEEKTNISLVPIGIVLLGISGFLAMVFLVAFTKMDWNLLFEQLK